MARLKQTQRKRVGSVPRLPVDIVAAIAAELSDIVERKTVMTRIPDPGSGGVTQAHFRFHVDPRESNLISINKIIRYLKGLSTLGVKYPKDIMLNMFGYIDIDYAGSTSNGLLSFDSHEVENPQGEDTDPIAICQWSVSTSPGLNPLDVSADSGSDIGADRQLVDNDSDLPDES
ncbi:hypothetical protein AgCh_010217 [Apium graveolens]